MHSHSYGVRIFCKNNIVLIRHSTSVPFIEHYKATIIVSNNIPRKATIQSVNDKENVVFVFTVGGQENMWRRKKKRCVRIVSILLNLQVTPQCKLNHLNDSKHFHICIFIDNFVGNRF